MESFVGEGGGGRGGTLAKEESVRLCRYSSEGFGAREVWGEEGQRATSGHNGLFGALRALLRSIRRDCSI